VSICAKGVSRGVHNIAFLLSPDDFRAIDLVFFTMKCSECLASKNQSIKGDNEHIDNDSKDGWTLALTIWGLKSG
jgi:hypothetical protein